MLTQKVIEQEVGAKVTVTDKAVTDFFNANRAQFNVPEEAYHIAQLVVTPVRDQQIANGTGDDVRRRRRRRSKGADADGAPEGRRASFRDLAAGYSEDPESAPRGGRHGPHTRLETEAGRSSPARCGGEQGTWRRQRGERRGRVTLVLVVAHEQAGQRDLSTPGVRGRITETLKARKEQLLRTAYLTSIRSDANVCELRGAAGGRVDGQRRRHRRRF